MGHVSISSQDKSVSKGTWNGEKSGAIGKQKSLLGDDYDGEVRKKTKCLEYHSREFGLCSVVHEILSEGQRWDLHDLTWFLEDDLGTSEGWSRKAREWNKKR